MMSHDGQSVVDMNYPVDDVWMCDRELTSLTLMLTMSQLHEHSSLFGRAATGYHFHSAQTCLPSRV